MTIFHNNKNWNLIFSSCFSFIKGFVVIFDSFFFQHRRIKWSSLSSFWRYRRLNEAKGTLSCCGRLHQKLEFSVPNHFNSRLKFIWKKVKKQHKTIWWHTGKFEHNCRAKSWVWNPSGFSYRNLLGSMQPQTKTLQTRRIRHSRINCTAHTEITIQQSKIFSVDMIFSVLKCSKSTGWQTCNPRTGSRLVDQNMQTTNLELTHKRRNP